MKAEIRITVRTSAATRDLLDHHVRASGRRKGNLVVTRASGAAMLRSIRTGKPTKALRELLRKALAGR